MSDNNQACDLDDLTGEDLDGSQIVAASTLSIVIGALISLSAAYQTILSKSLIQLIIITCLGSNQFKFPAIYGIIASFLVLRGFQLYFLNWGLEEYDIMVFLPITGAFEIIFGTGTFFWEQN